MWPLIPQELCDKTRTPCYSSPQAGTRLIWMWSSHHTIHGMDLFLKPIIRNRPPGKPLQPYFKGRHLVLGESVLWRSSIPRCGHLKEMMSMFLECALAIIMARSLASEPLFVKKMTWRENTDTWPALQFIFLLSCWFQLAEGCVSSLWLSWRLTFRPAVATFNYCVNCTALHWAAAKCYRGHSGSGMVPVVKHSGLSLALFAALQHAKRGGLLKCMQRWVAARIRVQFS